MSGLVVGLVLLAAALHAGWNAIAKSIPSRLAASVLISGSNLAGGVVALLVFPLPDRASWPYLVVSALLQTAYLILLTASYGHGDFSQLYPLVRGLAVVQVTAVSIGVLGETLSTIQLAGVSVIAAALIALTFTGGRRRGRAGVGLALLTSVCIAGYSLVDGQGVRHSGSPFGYVGVLFVLQGVAVAIACLALSRNPRTLAVEIRAHWRIGVLGGLMSMVAYAIVVWAQNRAPLALVSALRETSVLLAGLIGWLFFRERLSPVRTVLTVVAVGGVVALQLG